MTFEPEMSELALLRLSFKFSLGAMLEIAKRVIIAPGTLFLVFGIPG